MIFTLRKKDPNDPRTEIEIWKDELVNSPDNGKLIVRNLPLLDYFAGKRVEGRKYRFSNPEDDKS